MARAALLDAGRFDRFTDKLGQPTSRYRKTMQTQEQPVAGVGFADFSVEEAD